MYPRTSPVLLQEQNSVIRSYNEHKQSIHTNKNLMLNYYEVKLNQSFIFVKFDEAHTYEAVWDKPKCATLSKII